MSKETKLAVMLLILVVGYTSVIIVSQNYSELIYLIIVIIPAYFLIKPDPLAKSQGSYVTDNALIHNSKEYLFADFKSIEVHFTSNLGKNKQSVGRRTSARGIELTIHLKNGTMIDFTKTHKDVFREILDHHEIERLGIELTDSILNDTEEFMALVDGWLNKEAWADKVVEREVNTEKYMKLVGADLNASKLSYWLEYKLFTLILIFLVIAFGFVVAMIGQIFD